MIVDNQLQEQPKMQRTHEQVMALMNACVVLSFFMYPGFHYYAFLIGVSAVTNLLAPRQFRFAIQAVLWILNLYILDLSDRLGYKGINDSKMLFIVSFGLQALNLRYRAELLDEVAAAMWTYAQIHTLQVVHWRAG